MGYYSHFRSTRAERRSYDLVDFTSPFSPLPGSGPISNFPTSRRWSSFIFRNWPYCPKLCLLFQTFSYCFLLFRFSSQIRPYDHCILKCFVFSPVRVFLDVTVFFIKLLLNHGLTPLIFRNFAAHRRTAKKKHLRSCWQRGHTVLSHAEWRAQVGLHIGGLPDHLIDSLGIIVRNDDLRVRDWGFYHPLLARLG